jgi:hypothetical protein
VAKTTDRFFVLAGSRWLYFLRSLRLLRHRDLLAAEIRQTAREPKICSSAAAMTGRQN